MKSKTNSERALDAYKTHLRETSALVLSAMGRLDEKEHAATREDQNITWANDGDMLRARETAVELLWLLGGITSDEAETKYGVSL